MITTFWVTCFSLFDSISFTADSSCPFIVDGGDQIIIGHWFFPHLLFYSSFWTQARRILSELRQVSVGGWQRKASRRLFGRNVSRGLFGRNPGHVHRKARGIDTLANVSCNWRVTRETISSRCLNHGVSQDSYVHAVLTMEYHKTRMKLTHYSKPAITSSLL